MNRLDPADIRSRLQAAGAWSNQDLGQHFLIDGKVLAAIVQAAKLQPDDIVVEIGPGPGVLTEELVGRAHRVIAFEIDQKMASIIKSDFPQVELHQGDVLREAPAVLDGLKSYKIVANIPYQITTPLLKLLVEGGVKNVPTTLTLLLQKEVGQRLSAAAGASARGYLSVMCQYFCHISYICDVPPHAFWPAPEVQSAVIHMTCKQQRSLPVEQEAKFLRFVHTMFAQRRKQLKNVVAGIRGTSAEAVLVVFRSLGIPDNARAQELTEAQWLALFNANL